MIKRIFDIVTFPFYLTYQLISFPFKIAKIIIEDKNENKRNNKGNELGKISQKELIEIGQLLFSDFYIEYENLVNSYHKDKNEFISENKDLISNYGNFKFERLKPIELVYIFGDSKEKLWTTDWRGEENLREIENFLVNKLQLKIEWKNVNEIRNGVNEQRQRDGEFMINFLKTIDKDLETLKKRLIFLDLSWDAYVYTVIDQASYETVTDKFGTLFHGTENLRK